MKALTLTIAFAFAFAFQGFAQNIQEEVYDNGVLKRQVVIDGEKSQVKTYYDNGQLKEIGSFVNEKAEGVWVRFDEEGNKVSQGSFVDGEKHGLWLVWSADGEALYHINYENNVRTAAVKVEE